MSNYSQITIGSFVNPFDALDMSKLDTGVNVSLKDGRNVTLRYARLEDANEIAHLVQKQRLANDTLPAGYIPAAIAQRDVNDRNFFEAYWHQRLSADNPHAKAVVATAVGNDSSVEKCIGVVRYEALPVGSADVVTAINRIDHKGNPPEFDIKWIAKSDITQGLTTAKFGELHQLYVDPEYQGRGLGRGLFDIAAQSLTASGCKEMLVNVLSSNQASTGFYQSLGANLVAQVIEHNTRNGTVFHVPCDFWVRHLNEQPVRSPDTDDNVKLPPPNQILTQG